MCFRCLIFNLSGLCELLFLLCFIASWTWEVVSVMLYACMLGVALLMCLFVLCVACLTMFVNCLVKNFAMCLNIVTILLLNVMDVFRVCGCALLLRPCMVFQRVCVLCLWSIQAIINPIHKQSVMMRHRHNLLSVYKWPHHIAWNSCHKDQIQKEHLRIDCRPILKCKRPGNGREFS